MNGNSMNTESTDESNDTSSIRETEGIEDDTVQNLPTNQTITQALANRATQNVVVVARLDRRSILPENHRSLFINTPTNYTFSRMVMAAAKYPDERTLRDYSALQQWMYLHSMKRSTRDICQSIAQIYLAHSENYDSDSLLHLNLLFAEAYQSIGQINQGFSYFHQARSMMKTFDAVASSNDLERVEQDRKKKKLEDIGMKLQFQSNFQLCLIERDRSRSDYRSLDEFNERLSNTSTGSPDECRRIWREIILQCAKYPTLAQNGADWLLSYANICQRNTLAHANILYVALNLLLIAYESSIFTERSNINVFQMLNDIAAAFEQFGDQSKQFSPIHKMSHVWGTAAIAYYFKSDRYAYLVCASMMRASLELLGISFCSSGIESLYVLAEMCVPEFFKMMSIDPGVKLHSPECLNYFRNVLANTDDCIRYSSDKVHEFVVELFNVSVNEYLD